MYNAEVLSKFPVVQHFPFGSLFSFSPDPNAKKIQATVHTASQPKSSSSSSSSSSATTPATARPQAGLRDPLADPMMTTRAPMSQTGGAVGVAAPWARWPTKAPWASQTPAPPPSAGQMMAGGGTAAPWAKKKDGDTAGSGQASTRAPWADRR